MNFYEEIASDLTQVFNEFAKEIRIGQYRIQALISESQETLELSSGGFTAGGNFTVKIRSSDLVQLPLKPTIGSKITYAGETFRIVRISNRPPHPIIAFTVEPIE